MPCTDFVASTTAEGESDWRLHRRRIRHAGVRLSMRWAEVWRVYVLSLRFLPWLMPRIHHLDNQRAILRPCLLDLLTIAPVAP
jgi:hypothetical protein